jgi:hypothetical protein
MKLIIIIGPMMKYNHFLHWFPALIDENGPFFFIGSNFIDEMGSFSSVQLKIKPGWNDGWNQN